MVSLTGKMDELNKRWDGDNNDNIYYNKIKVLENELDEIIIKYNEAMSI